MEEAFYTTDRVMTCSFHKFGEYFPGTGTQEDRGRGKGKGYAVNVPLKDGITDEAFKGVFEPVCDVTLLGDFVCLYARSSRLSQKSWKFSDLRLLFFNVERIH